jgi:hypothetical protein
LPLHCAGAQFAPALQHHRNVKVRRERASMKVRA